jgi:hypothetical protein
VRHLPRPFILHFAEADSTRPGKKFAEALK